MPAAATINRVRELARSRLADAESRYNAIVETLAAGGDVAPEDVLGALADTDRSDEDLQADVSRTEAKAAMQAKADTLPELRTKLAESEAKRDALSKELTDFKATISRRIVDLEGTLTPLALQVAEAERARDQISRGEFDSQATKLRKAEVANRIRSLRNQMQPIEDELQRARHKVPSLEAAVEATPGGPMRKTLEQDLAGAKRTVAMYEGQLRPLQAALVEAQKQLADLDGANS